MDALEYEKERIRMCRTMVLTGDGCGACPLYDGLKYICRFPAPIKTNPDIDTIEDNIDRVIKWAKEHPAKTRQSEFLKMFPNADIDCILPCDIDKTLFKAHCYDDDCGCTYCKTQYWNEEVTDND